MIKFCLGVWPAAAKLCWNGPSGGQILQILLGGGDGTGSSQILLGSAWEGVNPSNLTAILGDCVRK